MSVSFFVMAIIVAVFMAINFAPKVAVLGHPEVFILAPLEMIFVSVAVCFRIKLWRRQRQERRAKV